MIRRWPYLYLVAVLLPTLFLAGCDQQSSEPFSVEVRVETQQGEPVRDASVGVRPCYELGDEVACSPSMLFQPVSTASAASPVELTSWEVQREGSDAVLTWTTASETNNDRFEIMRKIEGGSFEQIATVDGQGTTDETTHYQYRYENLRSDTEYQFRLRFVATDGDVQKSTLVALQVPKLPRIEPIVPNPFRDGTSLRVEVGTTSIFRSTVHTLNGTQVETVVDGTIAQGIQQLSWSPQDLPDGLYELRTRIGTNGEVAARDTAYAAIVRGPANAAPLGTTSEDGRVSTTSRVRFSSLFDVPAFEARDAQENRLGEIRIASTVQFVVTTSNGRQTYQRSVVDGKNSFTLTVSP